MTRRGRDPRTEVRGFDVASWELESAKIQAQREAIELDARIAEVEQEAREDGAIPEDLCAIYALEQVLGFQNESGARSHNAVVRQPPRIVYSLLS